MNETICNDNIQNTGIRINQNIYWPQNGLDFAWPCVKDCEARANL